jgi:4-hydroxy-4-methyl-2-oxoglutarate aldolase
MAHARNVAGTVIDGVNRDVARALQLSYPIYSKGRYMRTGKDRVEVSDVGRPVSIGGLQVAPGDLLIGDADGVIRVPAALEVRAAEICAVIAASEEKIVADVLSGVSLAEARRRHGYHLLQRKQSQA